jgi:hypothetical protein
LKTDILADGTIDDREVALIRQELEADGMIDKEEVEFLIALRNEAREVCPAFEEFFFTALERNVLTDGVIDAEEAVWLRQMLFADGKIDDRERMFLRKLDAQAQSVCREFEQLYNDCMRAPK